MLDVFFLSMGELCSEENWLRLLKFVPTARRVDNVKGIYNAHKACAELSNTENFWVVDADAWIVDGFSFEFEPSVKTLHWEIPETECVLVWPSQNPVNGLTYGYGGVKLFPRLPFLEKNEWLIDLSTTIGRATVSMPDVSCETRYNSTPESAWLGAFRECAKLASLSMIKSRVKRAQQKQEVELNELLNFLDNQDWSDDKKINYKKSRSILIIDRYQAESSIFTYWDEIEQCSKYRLIWCTQGWHNKNGKYSIIGAKAGSDFGLKYGDDPTSMNMINDWDWLKKEFRNVTV